MHYREITESLMLWCEGHEGVFCVLTCSNDIILIPLLFTVTHNPSQEPRHNTVKNVDNHRTLLKTTDTFL